MSSINKVMILGRLGDAPMMRRTRGGRGVANFSLATHEYWRDKSGERQERTTWHRVVVWGKLAENCTEFLRKGQLAHVEGRIRNRVWTDKEGRKKYQVEVVGEQVVFLDRAKDTHEVLEAPCDWWNFDEEPSTELDTEELVFNDDDIPF